jgi:diguanylate cyclase (GGDEF)-like protein
MKRKRKLDNYYIDQELPDLQVDSDSKSETTSASNVISAQFTKVLDSLPFYVLLVDSAHHIQFANKAVRLTFNLSLEEITGQYCPKVVHGMDKPYPGCPVQEVIKGKIMHEKEYFSPELERWLLTTAYPTGIKTKDGLDIFYHTVRDITEQKQAEIAIEESERKYHRLFEEIREIVFITSPDGDLQDINNAGLDLLELRSRKNIPRINIYRDLELVTGAWDFFKTNLEQNGYVQDYELSFKKRNGDIAFVSISASAEKDEEGSILVIRGIMRDLTHEKLHQEAKERAETLEAAKKRFSTLTHQAIVEKHWDVGFEDEHIPTCWEVKDCKNDGCPVYGKEHQRCWLIAGTFCRGEVQGHFAQKLGSCVKCEVYQEALAHSPVSEIGENFNSLMWSLREKEDLLQVANKELESQNQELQELHQAAKERADTDGLTGLKNHGHFQRYLKREVDRASRYQRPLSLLMIDLDNFKVVNDKFGHQKGDAVLSNVGKLLKDELRDVDYAARYGGEEFVVVMPEIAGPEAVKAADRLRRKFDRLYIGVDLPEDQTAASFGVADFPSCATDNNSLIAAADGALLFAKRQGRNRVAYFRDLSEAELNSEDIDSLNSRLDGAGFQTIRILAAAVDTKDCYPEHNMTDLSSVAAGVAKKLSFSQDQVEALMLATKLHDIGKIGVPVKILQKKEKLTPEELALLRQHPRMGEQILREGAQIRDLIAAVLYHHERWDGKGYPEGLHGEEIPLMARIVGILDAYRAMLSDRPYRKALTVEETISELQEGAGSQFDPSLIKLFIEQVLSGPEQRHRLAG